MATVRKLEAHAVSLEHNGDQYTMQFIGGSLATIWWRGREVVLNNARFHAPALAKARQLLEEYKNV